MDSFFVWRYFKEDDVSEFDNTLDEAALKLLISKSVKIPFNDPEKREFAIDFHFYNFAFCKMQAFNYTKISTLMSIMNEIFLTDLQSSEPSSTMSSSFKTFREMLLNHSVERPPKRYRSFNHIKKYMLIHIVVF
jgi:hypothetical protein